MKSHRCIYYSDDCTLCKRNDMLPTESESPQQPSDAPPNPSLPNKVKEILKEHAFTIYTDGKYHKYNPTTGKTKSKQAVDQATQQIISAFMEAIPAKKEEDTKTSKAFQRTYPAHKTIPTPYNKGYNQCIKDLEKNIGIRNG